LKASNRFFTSEHFSVLIVKTGNRTSFERLLLLPSHIRWIT